MKAKIIFLVLLTMTLCLFSCNKKGDAVGGKPVDTIELLSNEVSSSSDSWTKEDWDAAAERLKTAIAELPATLADDETIILNSAIPRMKVYADRHKNMSATFLVALSKYKSAAQEEEAPATTEKADAPETTDMGEPSEEVTVLDEGTPDEGSPYDNGGVVYGTQYDWLSTRYATEADLAGYDLGQLRVLRNSIYARHGRMFRDANLRSYFNSLPWYNGYRQEIPASELNQYEQYNIQFIQSRE